jgi:hypothetical protein
VIRGCACASAAMAACGGASLRPAAERTATYGPERVRAIRRATRSAMGSEQTCTRLGALLATRTPHDSRPALASTLELASGGPSLLTEDRQKPDGRLDGMHEARNTVPSRAERPGTQTRGGRLELRLTVAAVLV